ncbi:MAG: MlaA family lipoprotein [Gammaproteobacteria bacterium WSBS_2016_MAG_OTU1]
MLGADSNLGYIVAPLLGPSSLPDIIGGSADAYTKPDTYLESNQVKILYFRVRAVDARAQFLDSEGLIELSLDEYSFVRDFREELRQKESFDDLWGEQNIWINIVSGAWRRSGKRACGLGQEAMKFESCRPDRYFLWKRS